MPLNSFSNGGYEKVSMLDEFDENENGFNKSPTAETKANGNHTYDFEFSPADFGVTKNGHIPDTKIELYPEKHFEDDPKFPKEKRKLLFAFLAMVAGFIINDVSIVLTHQKVPDKQFHPPLPDIMLDNVTKVRWLNDVADVLVILSILLSVSIIALHRHRWILCRRVFLLLAMLYSFRSVTMYVTVLPLANDHVYCSPKMSESLSVGQKILTIAEEVMKLLQSGGLPITGKKTICGDYIYSGHTIILMLANLLVREYIPKRYNLIHWLSWITAWIGMICLLVSHGHYTIDVIVGYYTTTRLFWIYHTFSNHTDLKIRSSANSLSNIWWFRAFQYFEVNVSGKLPKEYSISRLRRKIQTLSSR